MENQYIYYAISIIIYLYLQFQKVKKRKAEEAKNNPKLPKQEILPIPKKEPLFSKKEVKPFTSKLPQQKPVQSKYQNLEEIERLASLKRNKSLETIQNLKNTEVENVDPYFYKTIRPDKLTVAKNLKYEEAPTKSPSIGSKLKTRMRNPQEMREIFIVSEIFNKKY